MKIFDCIIIGGGQAGLSVAFYLRRKNIDYTILDEKSKPGGSWLNTWDSLKLFSPVQYSSLSGWMMPNGKEEYPTKNEFISYLEKYEKRYNFPIIRNTVVSDIIKENGNFKLTTTKGIYYCKTLVSATGTSNNPHIPNYPNSNLYKGEQIHSISYRNPKNYTGKKVLIVGGGNSGAQILAEVSEVTTTKWVTQKEPYFLPDEVDGRYLFNEATKMFYGKKSDLNISLNNIVMVDSVKKGRERNVFKYNLPFSSFYEEGVIWPNKSKEEFDIVIWCTGFKSNLRHLKNLNIIDNNRIATKVTRSVKEPNLWLVGYGNWTGYASATIYGVGKTAKHTAKEINETLEKY